MQQLSKVKLIFFVEIFIRQLCSTEMKELLAILSWFAESFIIYQKLRIILTNSCCRSCFASLATTINSCHIGNLTTVLNTFFFNFFSFLPSLFRKDLFFFGVFFDHIVHDFSLQSHKFIFFLDFALIQCRMNPLAALTFWILTIWFWMILYGWMKSMAYLLLLTILRDVKLLVSIVSGSLIMRKAVSQIR